ncbi:MAG: DUF1638 domain-containing protein [Sedimenticola sp.]
MADRLTLMVCDYFYKEVARVVEEEAFGDLNVVAYTADCDHPGAVAKTLNHSLAALDEGAGSVSVLGGYCLREFDRNRVPEGVRFHPMKQCFELFLGPEQLNDYLKQGVHLLTPGMLDNWQAQYRTWAFDDADAKAFFVESTSRLLLLDTGVEPAAIEKLQGFADKAGLSWELVNVGLDSLRLFIKALVAEWRASEQKKSKISLLNEKDRQLADYAMVNDMISGITQLTEESSIVERGLELFNMFCGPGQVIYLPLSDDRPGEVACTPPFCTIDDGVIRRLAGFTALYELDDQGGGFTLVIDRLGVRYGVVSVKNIAFPKYRQHYLNLSLNITPVIALALSNARTYQKQITAEARMKDLNRQLAEKQVP